MAGQSGARTTALLVVLCGVALGYAYFVDRGTASDAEGLFGGLRGENVSRLEVSHGDENLVLVRADGGSDWEMTSPRREPADPAAVDALLRELQLGKALRTVEPRKDIGPVRARAHVVMGRGAISFALGSDAPTPTGAAYVRVEGGPTVVVSQAFATLVLKGADAYRVRTLVPYTASEVQRVEWSTSAGPASLERAGESFRVGDAHGMRAARRIVDPVLQAIESARVDRFTRDDIGAPSAAEAQAQARAPVDHLVVVPRGSRPRAEIEVGGSCPGEPGWIVTSHVGGATRVGCTPLATFDALSVKTADLVDRGLLSSHPDEIEEVILEAGGQRLEMARRDAGWHERAPDDRELDREQAAAANALVAAMAGATAREARLAADADRAGVVARTTVTRTGHAAPETIELLRAGADGVDLALRKEDGALLVISRSTARLFEPHPIALRGRGVWAQSFDAAAITAIDDTCTARPQRAELHAGHWTGGSANAPLDDALVLDLVESLAKARADRWVAETDDGSFGFDSEGCRISLAVTGPSRDAGDSATRTLVFGAAAEGGIFARTLDRPGVFLVSAALRAVASHPPISAAAFRLDPAIPSRVVISRDGRRRIAQSSGDGFTAAWPADAGNDRWVAALTAFHAQAALHRGAPLPEERFDHPTLVIHLVPGTDIRGAIERTITVGALGHDGPAEVYYARMSAVDATFAIPRATVDALLEAW